MSADAVAVAAQLGREPEAEWRVAHRCSYGHPTVIANMPTTRDGKPFPTLYWLTCPHLVRVIGERESAGEVTVWRDRLADDGDLRFEVHAADEQYRAAREMEGFGRDPCGDVGIGGQADFAALKCLHARVAASLAGIPDPIGRDVLEGLDAECSDDSCAGLLLRYGSET